MKIKQITSTYIEYDSINELTEEEKKLCVEAEKAIDGSYAPYSNFHVGAALLLDNNQILHGSNQENGAYPSGLCAERVALFAYGALKLDAKVKALAVTARSMKHLIETPTSPCGGCLQVIAEYERKQNQSIKIILYCIDGKILICENTSQLMPMQFQLKA